MKGLWNWIASADNRGRLALIGSLIAALVGGAWTVFTYLRPATQQVSLDITIDQTVRIEVDKDLDELFGQEPGVF